VRTLDKDDYMRFNKDEISFDELDNDMDNINCCLCEELIYSIDGAVSIDHRTLKDLRGDIMYTSGYQATSL